jgi:DHA2 family multidrug resistance protein
MPPMEPSLVSQLGSAGDSALAILNAEISRQAAMVAYIDDFYLMMIVTLASLPLVVLLRKPKGRGGGAPPAMAD